MARLTLTDFLASSRRLLSRGPVALIFVSDAVEIASTLQHHLALGFRHVVALMPDALELTDELTPRVLRVRHEPSDPPFHAVLTTLCGKIKPSTWLYYGFNAEYLYFPFCEDRTIGEMLAFHSEERRSAMITFTIDLYAGNLDESPSGVSHGDAWLDRTGYYALARPDPARDNAPKERQFDFFGGLRWRFEEHVAPERRRIDRIGLFQSKPGLVISPNHRCSDEEYNTYACPWHNNITAATMSFRAAKALKSNPGSTFDIDTFRWHNSVPFTWQSQQLLDLGLIEPGQWF